MKRDKTRRESVLELDLTIEQKETLKEHFMCIDRLGSGSIEISDLKKLLEAVGETVTDPGLDKVHSMIEEKNLLKIELTAALRIWNYYRTLSLEDEEDADNDVLYAFVAMGGKSDKSGKVKKQRLIQIITVQFGVTIDIEEMLEEANVDSREEFDYNDFVLLFGPGSSQRTSRLNSVFSICA